MKQQQKINPALMAKSKRNWPAIICIALLVGCVVFLVTRLIVNHNYIDVLLVLAIIAISKLTGRFIRISDKDDEPKKAE